MNTGKLRKLKRREKMELRSSVTLLGSIWKESILKMSISKGVFFDVSDTVFSIPKHTRRKISRGYITPRRATRNEGDVVHIGRKSGW